MVNRRRYFPDSIFNLLHIFPDSLWSQSRGYRFPPIESFDFGHGSVNEGAQLLFNASQDRIRSLSDLVPGLITESNTRILAYKLIIEPQVTSIYILQRTPYGELQVLRSCLGHVPVYV